MNTGKKIQPKTINNNKPILFSSILVLKNLLKNNNSNEDISVKK